MRRSLVLLALLLLAIVPICSRAQQAAPSGAIPDGKVAVINTQVFPDRIGELRQKYEGVQNQFKDRSARLQAADAELKKMASDLENNVLSAQKQQEIRVQFEEKKKQLQRDSEDLNVDYSKAIEAAISPVRAKLTQFMENYTKQRNIIMIIELSGAAQTGIIAYFNPAADITEDVIAEYNKANPVPTAAPATAQPATRPGGK
jgi:Skp family chaperone for outer membrane proteins